MDRKQAVQFLSRDFLHHIDMMEIIKRGNAEILLADDRGVLIFNAACGTYMMSAAD